MNPIERAARAVAEYTGQRMPPSGDVVTCEGIARAVLAAVREPSRSMLEAGASGSGEDSETVAICAWEAMIDAALAE